MSICSRKNMLLAVLGWVLAGLSPAQAYVLYNTNGGQNLVGTDGQLPPAWVGVGSAPAYGGKMTAMWFADLQANDAPTLSTVDAFAKGATAANFRLGTGPAAWGTSASGHGLDYGLIHLNGPSDLSITLAADASGLVPAFSLYQGWDTGTSFVRTGTYTNNVSDPLGTVGLTYLGQASAGISGGSASLVFANLSGGDYTLLLGGTGSAGTAATFGGNYTVTLAAVPLPAAVWLFGSALAGLGVVGRRKKAS